MSAKRGRTQPPCSPPQTFTGVLLSQVGGAIRCTSRGPSPSQIRRPVWAPALAQVKGPAGSAGGRTLRPIPGFSGLIVQLAAGVGVQGEPLTPCFLLRGL